MTRYFYQRGAVMERLKDDTDLEKAIEVLQNPARYRGNSFGTGKEGRTCQEGRSEEIRPQKGFWRAFREGPENASTFCFKRKCIWSKTYLRFCRNASGFADKRKGVFQRVFRRAFQRAAAAVACDCATWSNEASQSFHTGSRPNALRAFSISTAVRSSLTWNCSSACG